MHKFIFRGFIRVMICPGNIRTALEFPEALGKSMDGTFIQLSWNHEDPLFSIYCEGYVCAIQFVILFNDDNPPLKFVYDHWLI